MMGRLFLAVIAFGLSLPVARAESYLYSFEGSSNWGTAAASMLLETSSNSMTVTLDNISPLTLDWGSGTNSPGITGFGFDLKDPEPDQTGWTLTAQYKDSNGDLVSTSEIQSYWALTHDSGIGRFEFDFYTDTENGSKGAIYNPDATSGFGGPPRYFSTAVLTINFDSTPVLDTTDVPFVRFQNVGWNGSGSLKLHGNPELLPPPPGPSPPNSAVPEPSTLALFGLGGIGLAGFLRRRRPSMSK